MYPHEFWTAEQTETLRTMWLDGSKAAQIAAAVGRSVNSVRNRAAMLNLPKRTGGRHSKNADSIRSGDRRKHYDSVAMVRPRQNRYDSSKAVLFLADNWRKRAA